MGQGHVLFLESFKSTADLASWLERDWSSNAYQVKVDRGEVAEEQLAVPDVHLGGWAVESEGVSAYVEIEAVGCWVDWHFAI